MLLADEGETNYQAWAYRRLDPPVIVLMQRTAVGMNGGSPVEVPPCGTSFLGRFKERESNRRIVDGEKLGLRDVYSVLADIDPRYGDLLRYCMTTAAWDDPGKYTPLVKLQREFKVENFHVLQRLSHTESSNPHFNREVRMNIAAYQFRATDGATEMVAVTSIPVKDMVDTAAAAQGLRMTFAVTDSLISSFRRDTMVALPRGVANGVMRVPVLWRNPVIRDGQMRVTAVDAADTLIGATRSVPFHVRIDEPAIALSDVVVADVGTSGPLERGSFRISPLPGNTVKTGDAFRLFFELYGVSQGDDVETIIQLRRTDPKTIVEQLRRGKRDERTLSFREAAQIDGRGIAVRDVEVAGDLIRGTYSIDVTVKLANGSIVKRSSTLHVEGS
jgi:hypothetical protein